MLETDQVLQHAHTRHRDMVVDIDGFKTTGNPIKFSRTPGDAGRRKPPRFGQDTTAVLREAGYSQSEIDRLLELGAVAADVGT